MNFSMHFDNFPFFALSKCNLRQIREADATSLFEYYNNKNVYRYLDWNGPSSMDHAIEVIKFWNKGYQDGWIIRFAITDKTIDEIIGTIFLNNFEGKRAEVGYELSENYWNKGIMSEALNHIVDLAFHTLRLTRVQATTCQENSASEHLLLKNGFQFEGLLRRYETHHVTGVVKDMRLYSIINGL